MATPDLTLPEQLLVLLLKERDGSLLDATDYGFALAGAVLAELVATDRAELEAGSSGELVTVTRAETTGDPVLDCALGEVVRATRRSSAERWVGRLAENEELRLRVARQLCRKGAIDEHEGRVRLIFLRTVYADLDPAVRKKVIGRVEKAIFEDGPVDGRTGLLVALAWAGRVLAPVFGATKIKKRRKRLRTILDEARMTDEESVRARAIVSATDRARLAEEAART